MCARVDRKKFGFNGLIHNVHIYNNTHKLITCDFYVCDVDAYYTLYVMFNVYECNGAVWQKCSVIML